VSLSDSYVVGYECLARGPAGRLEYPQTFLGDARRCRSLEEVEAAICRRIALQAAAWPQPDDGGPLLFVNLSAGSLVAGPDGAAGRALRPFASRMVVELTEDFDVSAVSCAALQDAWSRWLRYDFRLAADDLGNGSNQLAAVVALQPHYVKLDMALLRRIAPFRLPAALKRLTRFAKDLGAVPLAEKVESTRELALVGGAGINLVQGFRIAIPQEPAILFAGQVVPSC